jgi:hypothetical protein
MSGSRHTLNCKARVKSTPLKRMKIVYFMGIVAVGLQFFPYYFNFEPSRKGSKSLTFSSKTGHAKGL